MILKRRIVLDKDIFYIGIKLKYSCNKKIVLVNKKNNYFDMGDLSILINDIEIEYKKEYKKNSYDKDVAFMNQVIFIFDRVPFLDFILEESNNSKLTIDKKEIKKYIKYNKIELSNKINKKVQQLFK